MISSDGILVFIHMSIINSLEKCLIRVRFYKPADIIILVAKKKDNGGN